MVLLSAVDCIYIYVTSWSDKVLPCTDIHSPKSTKNEINDFVAKAIPCCHHQHEIHTHMHTSAMSAG